MTKHGTILLVQNDTDDLLLMRKGLSEAQVAVPVQVVKTYPDAVQYLGGEGMYANRANYPLPFLILMDLKLPGEGGFALLRWLYDRPGLKNKFTVVVLAASTLPDEIKLVYELGAQSFLARPLQYRQLVDTLRHVKEYWIDLNMQPGDTVLGG